MAIITDYHKPGDNTNLLCKHSGGEKTKMDLTVFNKISTYTQFYTCKLGVLNHSDRANITYLCIHSAYIILVYNFNV